MTAAQLCKCSHHASEHRHGVSGEECDPRYCGCLEFRLDPKSRLRDETGEDAATRGAG
jgi:hypothetical protein